MTQWRCINCGRVGDLKEFEYLTSPVMCPSCHGRVITKCVPSRVRKLVSIV